MAPGAVEAAASHQHFVAIQQRVQADVDLSLQVRRHHFGGQWQVVPVLVADALAPPAPHRRDPAALASARVVEPGRVHVRASSE